MLDLMGMERGVLNAFHGMYSQLRRKFKTKGCPGSVVASHQWNLTRMPFERHSNKHIHHNMEAHDRRHQEATSGSHQEAAAADVGTREAIVQVEECGGKSRPSMDMAVRHAVLLRRDGMAGGRAAANAPEPGPRKHKRPPAAAQEPQGPGGHASRTSVGPAGPDGNGLPSKHGDVASLPKEASDTRQPGNRHPPGLTALAY